MISFLEWLQPVHPGPLIKSAEPRFRGGMSYACLTAASQRGASALMVYLLLWHVDRDRSGVLLDDKACEIAGLSQWQRQHGIQELVAAGLVIAECQRGSAPLANVIDPYEGQGRFFGGGMSIRCLVDAFCCHKGGALAVYMAAHLAYTLNGKSGPVRLGKAAREDLAMTKSAWSRAVEALQRANLLAVEHRTGASPMVTPLDPWALGATAPKPTSNKPKPATAPQRAPQTRPPIAPEATRETSPIRDADAAAKAAALEQIRRFQDGG